MNTKRTNSIQRQAIIVRYVIGSVITLFLIVGCAKSTNHLEQQMNHTEEQIKFSTVKNETNVSQEPANKAKEIVASMDETTEIYAVNSKNDLVLAFDVTQMHRFELETFKKDVKKILDTELTNENIEVSTDEKIRLELQKLEEDLNKKDLTHQTLEKKIKHIISLSKEET